MLLAKRILLAGALFAAAGLTSPPAAATPRPIPEPQRTVASQPVVTAPPVSAPPRHYLALGDTLGLLVPVRQSNAMNGSISGRSTPAANPLKSADEPSSSQATRA